MSQHEPEASPQQQEAVRRLLAEARHDEPLPGDVAARLDGVLAQLATEGPRAVDPPEPAGPPGAVVVDLAARRRRRVAGLLGAAAAVVVLGVGVDQVVDRTGSGGRGDSATSADTDDNAPAADSGAGAQPEGATSGAGQPTLPQDESQPEFESRPTATVPRIGSVDFKATVLRLRGAPAVSSYSLTQSLGADQLTTESMFVCPPTVLGPGELVPVSYVGSPAVLAYRPPTGETQTVELLQCGSGMVVRSIVIPVR